MERQVTAGKPFYLQLSHYAVHVPHAAMEKTMRWFAGRDAGVRHSDATYAAMTKDLDTSVGMVLDRIGELGIADNTYVVFMSDNGAGGARNPGENAPLQRGKATLWEGGIRVPLIVGGPGIKPGGFCHANVVGYDLFATFCDLAGVNDVGDGVEGVSLRRLLRGETRSIAREGDQIVFHFPHYGVGPAQTPESAILAGRWKLIRRYESGDVLLFDLSNDVGETTDLSATMPQKAAELDDRLTAYLKRVDAQLPTVNANYNPATGRQERRQRRQGRPPGDRGRRRL